MSESQNNESKSGCFIITGAASGIGFATLQTLYEDGIRNIAACDMNEEGLKRVVEQYPSVKVYTNNFMNDDETGSLIENIIHEQGPVRGLVHAAGFDVMSPLGLLKYKNVEALFHIHAWVPLRLLGCISRKGRYAEGCSVVLISSMSVHSGAEGHTAYAAAKGAVEGFLPAAAAELSHKSIRLNAVVLGIVQTNMSKSWMSALMPEQMDSIMKTYPFGLGNPADPANMICFLLSEKARWISGQKVILDGGYSFH